ncbi:MAG: DUF4177 domain-containing protein [Nitrospiraceae bacterium]|nr:MAG: DUF4177 domain-containing protein [Nitrospiraceae bacterium]
MSKIQRWEYRTMSFPNQTFFKEDTETLELEEYMNKLGQEGWEVISVFPISYLEDSSTVVVLKRPL